MTLDCPRTTPLRVAIELDPEGPGVAGSFIDEQGAKHAFAGWLGLLTLLEDARSRIGTEAA